MKLAKLPHPATLFDSRERKQVFGALGVALLTAIAILCTVVAVVGMVSSWLSDGLSAP